MTPRYGVTCPTCRAAPGAPCRTRETSRVTDTHVDRIAAQHTRTEEHPDVWAPITEAGTE